MAAGCSYGREQRTCQTSCTPALRPGGKPRSRFLPSPSPLSLSCLPPHLSNPQHIQILFRTRALGPFLIRKSNGDARLSRLLLAVPLFY